MIYCNAQFIHFGDPGYTAYILLHISLAVLSIILIFCAFCCQGVYHSESMQIKNNNFLWHFHILFFVFIAPNLVYLHNLDINTVGFVSGTSVLLHLRHCSSLCDAHIWSYKGSKMCEGIKQNKL